MGEPKIVVVDYHKGNLSSVVRGLARAGAAACTSDDPEQIRNADGLVIPGVGAFYDAIAFMRQSGEEAAVLDAVAAGTPLLGICLGLQMLGLALGGKSRKLTFGHRGANHPVKDIRTGRVYITSQNHGYVIDEASLPDDVVITHRNLHDNTLEGFEVPSKKIMCVQYHPEASPGPTDNLYLFTQFVKMMEEN